MICMLRLAEAHLECQVVSGNRAGAQTALLDVEGAANNSAELQGEFRPSHIIGSLVELQQVIGDTYKLIPPGESAQHSALQ